MDSLTQIVLGAAVGEVVAGKKMGNRALAWGAIAGTIPDLDVIGGLFLSEIDNLAFHRGISHSILFAVVMSFVLSYIVRHIYRSSYHKYIASGIWFSIIAVPIIILIIKSSNILAFLLGASVIFLAAFRLKKRYFKKEISKPSLSWSMWINLFFWCILTHSLLDCFTSYGTQLFAPFSDYRASLRSIAVVDFCYTIPFLICVIWVSFIPKSKPLRRWVNYAGLGLSTAFLVFTIFNKKSVNNIFEKSLINQNISTEDCLTSPNILTNFLWYGASKTQDTIHYGYYSIFDESKSFEFDKLPRNLDWLDSKPDDRVIKILNWFTDGFFVVLRRKDGRLQVSDMRFGLLKDTRNPTADDFVFRFIIEKNKEGYYDLIHTGKGPPDRRDPSSFRDIFKRIKGK